MALRTFLRYLLITPIQIFIFLLISLPLALFAAITTFFSVIFLSSRLLLVYVDLIVSFIVASPSSPSSSKTKNTTVTGTTEGIELNTVSRHRHPHPLMIPRSPPRSPPRSGSSGWKTQQQPGGHYQQSFTAPSSPNIGRKRMALSSGFYQQPLQQQQQHQSFILSGGSSSSSSPPLSMKGAVRGKKGHVVVVGPGEEDDYFMRGGDE